MIADKILTHAETQPDKLAMSWRGERVTYAEIRNLVNVLSVELTTKSHRYFIESDSPVTAIVQLLACQLTENIGLIVSKEMPISERKKLIESYQFCDFASKNQLNNDSLSENLFLGVLTSGSSGDPKVIFKDNGCWEKAFAHQSDVFRISEIDNVFVLEALAYSANLNAAIHALWQGATVTFGELHFAKSWGKLFQQKKITSAFLVPSHLKLLLNQEIGDQIKSIVTAGEKLSCETARIFLEKSRNVLLTEYYGTAELGHISYHQNQAIVANPLSVGKAFPEVKIDISEKQLFVKSPYISPEFRDIKTVGDLGIWENGNLVLLGRSGRMFNRRGLNIYAQEIEQKALLLPSINEVYLLERIVSGQKKLHLIFSIKSESPPHKNVAKALITYLQALLPAAKCPNRAIEVGEIPRLSGGKIDEKRLVELLISSQKTEEESTCEALFS